MTVANELKEINECKNKVGVNFTFTIWIYGLVVGSKILQNHHTPRCLIDGGLE